MNANQNRTRPARSLTVTLAIAFFTLSAVSLLVIGSLAIFANYRSLQRETAANLELVALNASKTVAGSIQEKFSILETAVEISNPVASGPAAQRNLLESLPGLQPAFRQVVLLNANGRQLTSASRLSSSLSAQFEENLQEETLVSLPRAGQRYISPVYFDDMTSEPLVVIAVPAKNVFGDFQGVLAAELSLKFMWNLVDQLQVGETGYVYVVDNLGNLIAFRDTSRVLRGENVGQIFEVAEFIKNPISGSDVTQEVEAYPGLSEETVVGTYVPLGQPQWAVVTELPTSEANQGIVTFLIASIAAILGFAVLAGGGGVVLARYLAAPLVDLSHVATQLAEGDLSAKAKVSGAAEVAQVAETFNTMALRLRDLVGSLEQRVADRTRALETSLEVSRRLSAATSPRQLAVDVVEQVQAAFGYYHAHIYFFDEQNENLVMAGGTGEAGATMLASGHSIPKGRGLVGRAAETNEPVLVEDVTQSIGWLPNPLLPDTRSEAAVPISVGSQVLGVLDVQQNIANGLGENDIVLLQSLASQVAISLQNARSYEQSRAQAELESLVNVIGQRIQRTASVEEALQTAARELGTAIGANRVRAQIGIDATGPADEARQN